MEKKNVMTALWSSSEMVFKKLIQSKEAKSAKNFIDFIHGCPYPLMKLHTILEKGCLCKHIDDVTQFASITEDCNLFDASCDTSIDIIKRYLRILNNGGKVNSLWCYLDIDKKAVVHFVPKKGWYAEAYFLCDEESSVLHLTDDEYGKNVIAVKFTNNITNELKRVSLCNGYCLHDYLPRVTGDILGHSRGAKKAKNAHENTDSSFLKSPQKSRHDKGDGL